MNSEERDLISKFVARVGGAPQGGFGSVPSTTQTLPPVDPEADQFIAENFRKYPEARYRITQMAVVQEAGLVAAQNQIRQLQYQLQQAQQTISQLQQQRSAGSSGGFLGGLFGGGGRAQPQQQAAPPPGWGGQQGYAPPPQMQPMPYGMQPGMFRQGGSGFLGSALTTAAGVAGGMMAANALEGLFSGHHGGAGGDGGWGAAPSETVINNNYGSAAPDPFAGSGTTADQNFNADTFGNVDNSGFDNGGFDSGGFDGGGDWGGGDDQSF
ncbi:DUF2076 domain-containing protein [Acetobacter sp. AN02]|uniref:DUF2076 domain-containing protein n=1 Tax=Acetobacter sp. AN02 TaxID=2894186 RepID=UPI0024342A14|nr:DUF2076 domain-containing protein [Acetobacter sp. AN02]MDG6093891.1 DUF2076 domain-containing protein [Acetobacter sp. AN02]